MSRKAMLIISLVAVIVINFSAVPTLAAPSTTVMAQSNVPRFERHSACSFPVPSFLVTGGHMICGYVIVPELHNQPNGRTLRIAVAVYKRYTGPSPSDAVIMLQGGPGGSSDVFAQLFSYRNIRTSFTVNRDLIIFDQRGVGHSQPALACPPSSQTALSCARQLQSQGVNLAAYNTAEDAADINDIRIALGYAKLDVYGVSYGTLLAQALMRDHPEAIRDVVLDSVVPLGVDPDLGAASAFSHALTNLFAACAADATCNATYPNLHGVFSRLIARLNSRAIRVRTTDPANGKTVTLPVDGSTLVGILHEGMYYSGELGALPKLLYQVYDGNYTLLSQILADNIATNESVSDPVYYAVECSDMVRALTPPQISASVNGVLPEIATAESSLVSDSQDVCRNWPATNFNQPPLTPLYSNLPTLVLGADFDPITPPIYSREVNANLSNSYYVELPADAHASAVSEPCAFGLMVRFLNNPTTPDASCAANEQLNFAYLGKLSATC
jgi:pimeloyl-ACP methyl ester carboxylesterase